MELVDSHAHVSRSWYEPVETLIFHMDRCGLARAVLVQEMAQFDNDYLFDCVRRFPGRFAIVANVDVARVDAIGEVRRLAARGASGLRLDISARSPGRDPFAIWRAAAEAGLAISCHGETAQYMDAHLGDTLAAADGAPIVVEHLAGRSTIHDEPASAAARHAALQVLASYPNIYAKFHGLGEFAPRAIPAVEPFPFEVPVPPLLETAVALFGPSRMMWGSDHPPVSFREGYRNALELPMERLLAQSDSDRALMFGGVANVVFPSA